MRYRELLLERNILNLDEIQRFVAQVVPRAHNPAVRQWLQTALTAYLKKTYKRVSKVPTHDLARYWQAGQEPAWAVQAAEKDDLFTAVLDDELREQVGQVIDYLEAEGPNLGRLSFESAAQKSLQWHRSMAAQQVTPAHVEGTQVVKTYPEGIQWVQLLTPAALDAESTMMGHCIGRGGYDARLANGSFRAFSLRDAKGQAHVTAAFEGDNIEQVKGKQNQVPIAKYRPYVIDLLNGLKLTNDHGGDLHAMGIFHGAKGFGALFDVAKHVETLPSGNRFAELADDFAELADDYYLAAPDGSILVHFIIEPEGTINLHVDDKASQANQLRNDVGYVLNGLLKRGLKLGAGPDHIVLAKFGWKVQNRRLVNVAQAKGMKLVARNLLFRMVMNNQEALIVDETDMPVVYIAFAPRNSTFYHQAIRIHGNDAKAVNYSAENPGWERAIPFITEALAQANIILDDQTRNKFRLAGWFEDDGEWKPSEQYIADLEPVTGTSNWFEKHNMLWLWLGDRIRAGLRIKKDKDPNENDAYIVTGIDEAFAHWRSGRTPDQAKLAQAVADLFHDGIATLGHDFEYRYRPFLIDYDVAADATSDLYLAVDWNTPVTLEYTVENVEGDTVYETTSETTLEDAGHTIDLSEDYQWNSLALEVLVFRNGYSDEHPNDYDEGNAEDDYEDPAGYREKHGLDPDEPLPAIASRNHYISRRR